MLHYNVIGQTSSKSNVEGAVDVIFICHTIYEIKAGKQYLDQESTS